MKIALTLLLAGILCVSPGECEIKNVDVAYVPAMMTNIVSVDWNMQARDCEALTDAVVVVTMYADTPNGTLCVGNQSIEYTRTVHGITCYEGTSGFLIPDWIDHVVIRVQGEDTLGPLLDAELLVSF